MSYLAMSAAPIDNDYNPSQQNETSINKKRQTHNKTQKFRNTELSSQKVNSVLQSIHNSHIDDDDMGDYNPRDNTVTAKHSENFKPMNPYDFPTKPVSVANERKEQEGMAGRRDTGGSTERRDTERREGMTSNDGLVPQPTDDDTLDLKDLQGAFMNDAQVRDYYRRLSPNYNPNSMKKMIDNYDRRGNVNISNVSYDGNQVLIEKLNYMINLLEEQQDQKTGNITEEVILYSFLGVFIIFIVDSFTKVGKYVR